MAVRRVLTLLAAGGTAAAAALAWWAARDARRSASNNEERLVALRAAVRRACHDMNNPLAAAAINAELLSYACPDDAKAHQHAQKVQEQIQLAKDAVNALHNLSRTP
jgi:signal transduction histidine kinase